LSRPRIGSRTSDCRPRCLALEHAEGPFDAGAEVEQLVELLAGAREEAELAQVCRLGQAASGDPHELAGPLAEGGIERACEAALLADETPTSARGARNPG
jgi:hypothetical protein